MLSVLISAILHYIATKKSTSNKNKEIDENTIERHYVLAKEYAVNKEWKKAIWEYTVLIKAYPENITYLYARASAYTEIGDFERAIYDYMKITDIDAREVDAYLYMADIYNYAQQYEGTKQVLELALAVRPDNEEIKQAYNEVLNLLSEENILEKEPQANQKHIYSKRNKELQIKPKNKIGRKLDI